jgi:hypothetical protein
MQIRPSGHCRRGLTYELRAAVGEMAVSGQSHPPVRFAPRCSQTPSPRFRLEAAMPTEMIDRNSWRTFRVAADAKLGPGNRAPTTNLFRRRHSLEFLAQAAHHDESECRYVDGETVQSLGL